MVCTLPIGVIPCMPFIGPDFFVGVLCEFLTPAFPANFSLGETAKEVLCSNSCNLPLNVLLWPPVTAPLAFLVFGDRGS